ncbi:MAG: hypothetical protein AAFS13_08240 [Pseudomonadota bacterium]
MLKFLLILLIIFLILLILMRLWRGGGWRRGGHGKGPEPGDPGIAKSLTDDAIDKASDRIDGGSDGSSKVPVSTDDEA